MSWVTVIFAMVASWCDAGGGAFPGVVPTAKQEQGSGFGVQTMKAY
jgi:hypothetical protein